MLRNPFNNNLTDPITIISESNADSDEYSTFEDLLRIDNFITMESKDEGKNLVKFVYCDL